MGVGSSHQPSARIPALAPFPSTFEEPTKNFKAASNPEDEMATIQSSSTTSSTQGGQAASSLRTGIQPRQTNLSRKTSDASAGKNSLRMALATLGGTGGTISGAIRDVATDPQGVVQHRKKEKKDMQDLNDRFATYIERIRFYEVENKRLKAENDNLRKALVQLEQKMKELYEKELAQARAVIDETTKAKAAVELRVAGLEAEMGDYRKKYEEEARLHAITRESVPKLEKMIIERDAQLDYLTKTVSALEIELKRFKGEGTQLRQDLNEMRMVADQEVVSRIELESQLQSRDDEIQFLKNSYEEKIKILMETDVGEYQEYFSNELAMAIRDIRAEYEAINEAQQGADTEGWYKAKFNEMMVASQRASGDLASSKEEVKGMRTKFADSQKELMRLRAENASMAQSMSGMESEMEAMEKQFASERAEMEGEIASLRAQLAAQILELKELMDSKLALDAEIATYRRLLQGEESRVKDVKMLAAGGGGGGGSSMSVSGGGGGMSMSSSSSSMSVNGGGGSGMSVKGGGGGVVGGANVITSSTTTTTIKR